jgi:hypothetical protein
MSYYVKTYIPTGYTADADVWCERCATIAYGSVDAGTLDLEGNEIGAIFPDTETDCEEHCNRCREPILTQVIGSDC